MNARATATLGIRLMGIYVVIESALNLPYMLHNVPIMIGQGQTNLAGLVLMLALIAFWFGVAVAVLALAGKLAARLVPDAEAKLEVGFTIDQLGRLGFCLIGLLTLVSALPRLANHILTLATWNEQLGPPPVNHGQMAATGLQLVLGVVLILGAHGLHQLWQRMRETRGATTSDEEPPF